MAHGQSKASKALEKRIGGKHRSTTVVTIIALFVSLLFALLCVPGMHIPQDGDHTVIQGKGSSFDTKKNVNTNITGSATASDAVSHSSAFVYNEI